MTYLFEDDERDYKSKLIMNTYSGDATRIFTRGAGNLKRYLLSTLEREAEVVVYMDLPVRNDDATHIYDELRRTAYKYPGRVICLLIPCAEYYFIRSISDERLMCNKEDINIAKSVGYYLSTKTSLDNNCVSFENYCKQVLHVAFKECISVKIDNGSCFYFGKDCAFSSCLSKDTFEEKAERVGKEYPSLPVEFGWGISRRYVT